MNKLLQKSITYLDEKGFKHNLLGFDYILEAISLVANNRNYLRNITKMLLPDIAEHYDTTPSRVDRAIRHAIKLCGIKMTNSEFIAKAVDDIVYFR